MRTNYVLVDYENVQPKSLEGLDGECFRVYLFLGANQSKLPIELVIAMQKLGTRAEYVCIAGSGPNALDFHIAFYVGHLSAKDPNAYFHIISKDAGFDPLIQHLRDRNVYALRSRVVADIPLYKAVTAKSSEEKVSAIVANLRQRGAARPRTIKTLASTIASIFQKQLSEEELDQLLSNLQSRGFIVVTEGKVSYQFPDVDPANA